MSSQRYISDALKRKKQKVKKVKIYLILLVNVAMVVTLIFVLRLPAIQISQVKITGNVFVDTQEIEQKTNNLLSKNLILIIPNRNIFLFSKRELEKQIIQNPAIISVKIRKDFFHTLTIDITEQEKEMIYCTSLDRTECFYINKKGFVYAKVKDMLIPEQEVIIYNEQGLKKIQDTIIDEKTYIDIVLFIKNVIRQDIKIGEVYIKSDGVVEFITRDNTKLIASLFDEFKKDFANLMALFEKNIITKDQLSQIEYIDLRFGNKVFYKNKTN